MALTLVPDLEATITTYLRTVPEIDALEAKIGTVSRGDITRPWLRVTLLDSPRVGPVDHLIENYLTIDVFAGKTAQLADRGAEQVNDLARTVRAALNAMTDTEFDDVVITSVNVAGGRLPPDDSVEPARERHQLTATIHAHPR